MARKKRNILSADMVEVKITGPGCFWGDRRFQPGETAAVPVKIAQEWISTERATLIVAEVERDDQGTNLT